MDFISFRPSTVLDRLRSQPRFWALAVTIAVFGWSYAPNFLDLGTIWANEPNYSHGYLVIPIALVILWQQLSAREFRWFSASSPWWSWILLIAVLAVRTFAYEHGLQWTETATLVPVIACLVLTFGGWPLLRQIWPAVVFLVFMLPLPPSINDMFSLRLQRIATQGSCFLLQLTGFWVVPKGNIIGLNTPHGLEHLEVATACNGLRMLMTLAATITATIILIRLPNWRRIILLASVVPIALLSNILRIVGTGWCYYLMAGPQAKHYAHNWSGFLMMPLALVLVGLELGILSWLTADSDSEPEEDKRPIPPVMLLRTSPPKKKGFPEL